MTSVLLLCSAHIQLEFPLRSWNWAELVVATEARLMSREMAMLLEEQKTKKTLSLFEWDVCLHSWFSCFYQFAFLLL